jgi:hypothetical protein
VATEPTLRKPRRDTKLRSRIVEEHRRRKGSCRGRFDSGAKMTAYRQQALGVANAVTGTPSCSRDLRIVAPDAGMSMVGSSGWKGPLRAVLVRPLRLRDMGRVLVQE